jgi:hypothetical protein
MELTCEAKIYLYIIYNILRTVVLHHVHIKIFLSFKTFFFSVRYIKIFWYKTQKLFFIYLPSPLGRIWKTPKTSIIILENSYISICMSFYFPFHNRKTDILFLQIQRIYSGATSFLKLEKKITMILKSVLCNHFIMFAVEDFLSHRFDYSVPFILFISF